MIQATFFQKSTSTIQSLIKRCPFDLPFLAWTSFAFLAVSCEEELTRSIFIFMFVSLLCAITWPITFLVQLIRYAYKRKWRHLIFTMAAPVIAIAMMSTLSELGVTPDLICLEINQSDYMKDVAALPITDGHRPIKSWYWGSTGLAVSSSCIYTLVYDDSDEIALPPSDRSVDWINRQGKEGKFYALAIPPGCPTSDPHLHGKVVVTHLKGHFYRIEDWNW